MQVLFLSRENPLKEGMATHSSTLARKIPLTEEPGRERGRGRGRGWGGLRCTTSQPVGSPMSDMTEYAHTEKDDIHKRFSILLK